MAVIVEKANVQKVLFFRSGGFLSMDVFYEVDASLCSPLKFSSLLMIIFLEIFI